MKVGARAFSPMHERPHRHGRGQQEGAAHAIGEVTERDRAEDADQRHRGGQRADPEVADMEVGLDAVGRL